MTTEMSDPRELFPHELGDVLYAERTLVKTLPTLQGEASAEELALGQTIAKRLAQKGAKQGTRV